MKIGFLIPRSALYPAIGFDLLSGFNAYLKTAKIADTQIEIVNIGVAADNQQIYAACEQMLLKGTDVVIGYLNPRNIEGIHGLFAAANRILIALDSGFHFPNIQAYSHVVTLSLHGTLCSWLSSHQALENGMRKFVYTSSFYDAGYRSASVFIDPVLREEGTILFNYITPLKKKEFTIVPLLNFLNEQKPDALMASFCGDMAYDFLNQYDQSAFTIPILGSSFMLEETLLSTLPSSINVSLNGFVPWYRELESAENATFISAMNTLEKREANVFSLLAWDAAILSTLIHTHQWTTVEPLKGISFQSPRGTIRINAESHIGESICYPVEFANGKTVLSGSPMDPDQSTVSAYYQYVKKYDHIADTWFNVYPCLID